MQHTNELAPGAVVIYTHPSDGRRIPGLICANLTDTHDQEPVRYTVTLASTPTKSITATAAELEPAPPLPAERRTQGYPTNWWTITDIANGDEITRVYAETGDQAHAAAMDKPAGRWVAAVRGGLSRRRLGSNELTEPERRVQRRAEIRARLEAVSLPWSMEEFRFDANGGFASSTTEAVHTDFVITDGAGYRVAELSVAHGPTETETPAEDVAATRAAAELLVNAPADLAELLGTGERPTHGGEELARRRKNL